MLWSAQPSAASCPGSNVYFTDIGCDGGGSLWHSDGVRFRPSSGGVILQERFVLDTHSGAEAVKESQAIAAGLFSIGRRIAVSWAGSKNGVTYGTSFFLRLGPLGTTADTLLHAAAAPVFLAAASISCSTGFEIVRTGANTVRFITTGGITPKTGVGVTQAQVADITYGAGALDVANILTMAIDQNAAHTYTNRYFSVEVK